MSTEHPLVSTIRKTVRTLREAGFPPSEGYFLIVMSEPEAAELAAHLRAKYGTSLLQAYAHPPAGLLTTMRHVGLTWALTLGDAVVCYHADKSVPRLRAKRLH